MILSPFVAHLLLLTVNFAFARRPAVFQYDRLGQRAMRIHLEDHKTVDMENKKYRDFRLYDELSTCM